MDHFEHKIRRARPQGPSSDEPLSPRARADFAEITGHGYRSPRRKVSSQFIMVATAVVIAVTLVIGSLTWWLNSDGGLPVAEPESTQQPSTPIAGPQVYADVQELAAASDVVILAHVENTRTGSSGEAVSTLTVVEVFAGTLEATETVTVVQPLEANTDDVPLGEIDSDQLVLFLTSDEPSGTYALIGSSQAILAVNTDDIYSPFDDIDLNGVHNLAELRELLGTN